MRNIYQNVCRDGAGKIIASATVSVFLYNTATAASIYTTLAGATAVNSVTSGTDGSFTFYVDRTDYVPEQCFDLVIAKSGYTSVTLTNIDVSGVIRTSGDYVHIQSQGDPTAETTATTLTIAKILTGIITATHAEGSTQAYTLPTGTLCDASDYFAVNSAYDWTLINLSAAAIDTVTLTAGDDHTIVGNPIVQSANSSTGGVYGNSARWRTRKTAANTFVTYRIS